MNQETNRTDWVGTSPAEEDYKWCLMNFELLEKYPEKVIVVRNRIVIGSGDGYRLAWESALKNAEEANEPVPSREDVVFVVMPPDGEIPAITRVKH